MRSRRTTHSCRCYSSVLCLLVLLAAWCVLTTASRVILQTQVPILHPSSRQELKVLELFADEEPVDTLESFRVRFRQDRQWRSNILPQLCQHVRCCRDVPVVFATAIRDAQGRLLGKLEVLEGQEPIDALVSFSLVHQGMVSCEDRIQILNAVCRKSGMRCTRSRALMDSQRISGENNSTLGVLEIYDDSEPVDQIYRFAVDHNLPKQALQQLLSAFCDTGRVPCARSHPLVYSRPITTEDGRNLGRLEIPLSEEPVDLVYMFGLHHDLGKEFRQELLRRVCEDRYVQCNRDGAHVFAAPIKLENGTIVGTLKIMEDEKLADAVYHFAKQTNTTVDVRVSILETLCGRDGITCTRDRALLKSLSVSNGESGGLIGVIHVLEGEEPADVVYEFAQQHGLSNEDQLMLLEMICGMSTWCAIELLLNEEPADTIARFGNKHGLSSEEKLDIWTAVCKASGIPCTRSKGLIYQTVYTLPGTDTRERLDFMDGQEPTDIIYEYGKMRNLTLRQRKQLLHQVCNEPRRRPNCTRVEPMLLQIPVWETQNKKMGDLEILEGQEPIDMVYAFLEKHDLFQTEPLNTTLLEVVCNSTARVTCSRMRPRRILFSMQATYAGIQHTLQYVRPESDWICEQQPQGGQKCVHYVEILTKQFCATHMFEWSGCESRILDALRTQLEAYETAMWRGKDLYAKLGLVKSATREEIDAAYNTLVKRFNNETETYKCEKLQEAYETLSDPEEKYFYDLPCFKFFGLCGKKKKDGSISITAD
ncbi:Dnaj domain, partial [Globisporangium splendens]